MSSTSPRLVLVTPVDADPYAFAPLLAEAMDAGDVAAVIFDTLSDDGEACSRAAKILCPIVQERGAAFLLRDRADLVRSVGADGAHVTGGTAAIEAANKTLKPDLIVGAGDSITRHAAMVNGESQPDYVLLGRLDADADIPATYNLIEWWSGLFQLPCVALCSDDWTTVEAAVDAGADFLALRGLVWNNASGASAAVRRAGSTVARLREEAA
jgi:thiamine-phosphate pyrophosphorylase